MALAGEGAVCIWNDIAAEGRDEFYAWHLNEHMPERVGIPGFNRGRRYIACDAATSPEFFTLYEVDSPEVLQGQDYGRRLDAPTDWTRRATMAFRNTARALTRVRASFGPGPGGMLATLRFAVAAEAREDVARRLATEILPSLANAPQLTGAHLCITNEAASAVETAESRARTDIRAAPAWIILLEACNAGPLDAALDSLLGHPGSSGLQGAVRGLYRLEHTRLKTAYAPG
jgi:hypothetical protein